MQGESGPFIVGCIFLFFGVLAVLGVLGALWRSRRFRGRADGTLIALETPDGRTFRKPADVPVGPTAPLSFRPIVTFSLAGKSYTVRGPFLMREVTKEISSSGEKGAVTTTVGPMDFEPGQTVPVAYNPSDPNDATLRRGGLELEPFAIQVFMGFMCIVVALLIFLFNGNLAWLGPDWHPGPDWHR